MGKMKEGLLAALDLRRVRLSLWGILALVYFLRVLNIDADLPPWGVLGYQPIDEGIYSALAINAYNYGTLSLADIYPGGYSLVSSQDIASPIMNLVVYLGMKLFGDNYFGFRVGSVVIGFVSLLVIYSLTCRLFEKCETIAPYKWAASFLAVLIMTISFVFYNASRIVEPSIYRMLSVLLVAWFFAGSRYTLPVRSFFIGLLVVGSVFFIYATNVFLGLAVIGYLTLLIIQKRSDEARAYLLWGFVGCFCAYLLALLYYGIWGTSPLANLLSLLGAFGGTSSSGYGSSYAIGGMLGAVKNARDFFSSNVVLYCLPVAGICCGLGPVLARSSIRPIRESLTCLILICVGMLLQTLAASDFIVRKQLVIFPIFVLLTVVEIATLISERHMTKRERALVCVSISIACAWLLYIAWYRACGADTSVVTAVDYSQTDKKIIFLTAGSSVILLAALLGAILRKKPLAMSAAIALLVGASFLQNGLFLYKYNHLYQTYSDRDAMIALGKMTDGQVVAGDYAYGFTLYNDYLPLKNDRNVIKEYLGKHPDALFLDYADANHFTLLPLDLWQTLELVEEYPRNYRNRAAGGQRNIALYETTYRSKD